MKLSKIEFKGKEMYVIDERIKLKDKREDLFHYGVRHSDNDFSDVASIEQGSVRVNCWGTVVTKEPIDDILVDGEESSVLGKYLIFDDNDSEEFDSKVNYTYSGLEQQEEFLVEYKDI